MRLVNYSEKAKIIDLLVKSFETNISVNYVVKKGVNRVKRIRTLMDYSFELCWKFGEIYQNTEKNAVALVLFPDKKRTTLKTILLDAKLAIRAVGLKKVIRVLNRESAIKKHYPDSPIMYLWFIGVDPLFQKKGLGSKFLDDIMKKSNEYSRPIYLETSMIENLSFYSKHKFEVYKELHFDHLLYLLRSIPNKN